MAAQRNTFVRALLRPAVAAIVLTHLALAVVCYHLCRRASDEMQQRRLFDFATLLVDEAYQQEPALSLQTLQQTVRESSRLNPDAEFFLLDESGKSLWSTPGAPDRQVQFQPDELELALAPALPPLPAYLHLTGELEAALGGSVAPVSVEGRHRMLVVLYPDRFTRAVWSGDGILFVVLPLSGLFVLSMITTALLVAVVARYQTSTLRRIHRMAASYLAGDTSARVESPPRDEIGDLGTALNNLAEQVVALEAATRQNELQRRNTLGGLVHDLGSPWAALSAFVEMFRTGSDPAKSTELLRGARRNLERLSRLTDDLGSLSQATLGELTVHPGPVEIGALIDEVAGEMRVGAASKGLKLTVHHLPSALTIIADRNLLQRMIQNLVGNAVRYTPAGGSVSVSAVSETDHILIHVQDTGVGIPAHELPNLFREFVRGAGAKSVAPEGSGIGLALVKRFAELHGGSVSVESTVGAGSTFTLRLRKSGPMAVSSDRQPVVSWIDWKDTVRRLQRLGATLLLMAMPQLFSAGRNALQVTLVILAGGIVGKIWETFRSHTGRFLYFSYFALCFCVNLSTNHWEILALGYLVGFGTIALLLSTYSMNAAVGLPLRTMATLTASYLFFSCLIDYQMQSSTFALSELYKAKLLPQLAQNVETFIEESPNGYPAPELQLRMYRLMPEYSFITTDLEGKPLTDSEVFTDFARSQGTRLSPLNGDASRLIVTDYGTPDGKPMVGRELRVPHRANWRAYFVATPRDEQTMWPSVFQGKLLLFVWLSTSVACLTALSLGRRVYKQLRARLEQAQQLLREETGCTLAQPLHGDELDEILQLLAMLRNNVSDRTTTLREMVREQCTLVERIHSVLSAPLVEIRRLLHAIEALGAVAPVGEPLQLVERAQELVALNRGVVQEIVEYVRISDATTPAAPEPFALGELVEDILASRDCHTDLHLADGLPWVTGDVGAINRALELLIDSPQITELGVFTSIEVEALSGAVFVSLCASCPAAINAQHPLPPLFALRKSVIDAYLRRSGSELDIQSMSDGFIRCGFSLPVAAASEFGSAIAAAG